jgi:hypothetical protein
MSANAAKDDKLFISYLLICRSKRRQRRCPPPERLLDDRLGALPERDGALARDGEELTLRGALARGAEKLDDDARGPEKRGELGCRGVAKLGLAGRGVAKLGLAGRGVAKLGLAGRGVAKLGLAAPGVPPWCPRSTRAEPCSLIPAGRWLFCASGFGLLGCSLLPAMRLGASLRVGAVREKCPDSGFAARCSRA